MVSPENASALATLAFWVAALFVLWVLLIVGLYLFLRLSRRMAYQSSLTVRPRAGQVWDSGFGDDLQVLSVDDEGSVKVSFGGFAWEETPFEWRRNQRRDHRFLIEACR